MEGYEIESKLQALERKVDDLDYDLRRAVDELRDEIAHKANKHQMPDDSCL